MDFVHQELADQVQAVHIVVFPLHTVWDLPKLWLSLVAAIPQVVRLPHLIFNFIGSSLNKSTAREAPEEFIRFGSTLFRIIRRIIQADP